MVSSSFDRSACCLCMRSACIRMDLYTILVLLNMCIGLTSLILGTLYFCSNLQTVFTPWLILHILSFLLDLAMSTYPFRYWIGMEGKELGKGRGGGECCYVQSGCYSGKTYISIFFYIIAMITIFAAIGTEAGSTENWKNHRADIIRDSNRMIIGIVIYYFSLFIVFLWTLVRKSTCTDHVEEAGNIYDQDTRVNIDTGANGAVLFLISYGVLNGGFAVYWVDLLIYYVVPGCACAGMASGAIIGIYAVVKGDSSVCRTVWSVFGGGAAVSAIACFIYALIGFDLDPDYLLHTRIQWISLLVQGGIPLAAIALIIIVGITYGIVSCAKSCCANIKGSIDDAKRQVAYETGPLIVN